MTNIVDIFLILSSELIVIRFRIVIVFLLLLLVVVMPLGWGYSHAGIVGMKRLNVGNSAGAGQFSWYEEID